VSRSRGGVERGVQLSVVVPCRNAAETLGEQLEALTRQSFRALWEVVVVDDGSTDDTRAVAEGFLDRLPLVVVDAGDGHHSPARARNVGVQAARGERILFCDSDDVVDDGWGSALEHALDEHGFVCARRNLQRLKSALAMESNRDVPEGRSVVGYAQASRRRGVLLLCPSAELARPPRRLMRE
jgi:glycosyltransferase involved in cell wall biosynthesis